MKKLVCLGLCLILSSCTSTPVAKNDAERKVNVNVIEVSASTIDEIEEMAIKDVEDTKAKLESERDALSEEITDFDIYTKNVDKVKAYYDDALKQTELLSVRLREYAYKYAELIMNEDVSYKVKYKYDGIIKDAYDTEDYDVWSDASSDAYDDWSNCLSDIYDVWSDMQSDIYEFQSDLRSEVYDHDDERAQKKMDKFKKSILRMKEDAND